MLLSEFGTRRWSHITKPFTAELSYGWVDRILVIDESKGRRVIDDTKFSTFDLSEWVEWSEENNQASIDACKR